MNGNVLACRCVEAPSAFSYTQNATDITFSASKSYERSCGTYSMLVEIKPAGVPFDGTNLFQGPGFDLLGLQPYPDLILTNEMIEANVGVFPSYIARVAQANFRRDNERNCGEYLDNGTSFSLAPPAVPALGQWGLIICSLLLLIFGAVSISRVNERTVVN